MKDNLQFRVSAELKNILGRDLITSPDIAILELVKNSYDAHASKVEITFDEDYLAIADNGKGMSKDDLIMAFFPCIKFCNIAEYNQRSAQEYMRKKGVDIHKIYQFLKKESDERYFFYQKALKMHGCVEFNGLRMIMENPWHESNYTNYFWFSKPAIIDRDRTMRGDLFKKPTGYWFTNCQPTNGCTIQQTPKSKQKYIGMTSEKNYPKEKVARGSKTSGLCSEERSMISPDYARNFICDFIIGKKQDIGQLNLF
jgi:hypothetical protein